MTVRKSVAFGLVDQKLLAWVCEQPGEFSPLCKDALRLLWSRRATAEHIDPRLAALVDQAGI